MTDLHFNEFGSPNVSPEKIQFRRPLPNLKKVAAYAMQNAAFGTLHQQKYVKCLIDLKFARRHRYLDFTI